MCGSARGAVEREGHLRPLRFCPANTMVVMAISAARTVLFGAHSLLKLQRRVKLFQFQTENSDKLVYTSEGRAASIAWRLAKASGRLIRGNRICIEDFIGPYSEASVVQSSCRILQSGRRFVRR